MNVSAKNSILFIELLVISAIPGDDGEGEPPVSISNTEVKPFSADSTWLETTWEGRTSPGFFVPFFSAHAVVYIYTY